jgi:hypothetical protein
MADSNVGNDAFYNSLLDLASTRDFRMLLIQPGNYIDKVICTIELANLDDKPKFAALSYTWQDFTYPELEEYNQDDRIDIPRFIHSGSQVLQIRINLFQALRRLRLLNEPRALCVDQICVKQNNIVERNQQVSLMKDIYSSATEVNLWLGESNKDTAHAITIINHLAPLIRSIDSDSMAALHNSIPSGDHFTTMAISVQAEMIKQQQRVRSYYEGKRSWEVPSIAPVSEDINKGKIQLRH